MLKIILDKGSYFLAIVLVMYFFVGAHSIQALQMASLMTCIQIVILVIDAHYKKVLTLS